MKRALLFFLALSLCVSSFLLPARAEGYQKYSRMELGIFDTEITLIGYCRSQQEFNEIADGTMAQLKELNRIFDAYNSYAGLNNLWYINRYADDAPV